MFLQRGIENLFNTFLVYWCFPCSFFRLPSSLFLPCFTPFPSSLSHFPSLFFLLLCSFLFLHSFLLSPFFPSFFLFPSRFFLIMLSSSDKNSNSLSFVSTCVFDLLARDFLNNFLSFYSLFYLSFSLLWSRSYVILA